jgi:hypothetical protein
LGAATKNILCAIAFASRGPRQDILDELDPRKPTFQWLYTLSFDWSILDPFISRIRAGLQRRRTQGETKTKPAKNSAVGKTEELLQFQNRFCEAAYELAEELDLPLTKLGVMFDRVLTTGTRKASLEDQKDGEKVRPVRPDDESSIHGITLRLPDSDGVMLVVVRELGESPPHTGNILSEKTNMIPAGMSSRDVDTPEKYTSKGYRLAAVSCKVVLCAGSGRC